MNEIVQHAEAQAPAVSHPLPVAGEGNLLAVIARAASDPAVDVTKMQALMEMQERMEARQAEAAFNAAFIRLSAKLPRIKKDGRVDLGPGKGGYRFTTLDNLDSIVRPLLHEEGFALSFDSTAREGGGANVTVTLLHERGHTKPTTVSLPLDAGAGRNNLQALGSTLSYARRYAIELALHIIREGQDTDAQGFGAGFIGPDQVKQIEKLIKETGANRDAFLDFLEVGSVEGITARDFPKALNALAAKKRQGGRAQP